MAYTPDTSPTPCRPLVAEPSAGRCRAGRGRPSLNPVHVTSNLSLLGFALASVTYLVSFQKGTRQVLLLNLSFSLFLFATLASTAAAALTAQSSTLADMSAVLLTSAIGWLSALGHIRFK